MAKLNYHIQLKDLVSGEAIIAAGGKVYVAAAGAPAKLALTDKDNNALSNPLSLTRGAMDFFVADTVQAVDLFIQAPGGQFIVVKNVQASGPNEIAIDSSRLDHTMVIPFDIDDTAANTETNTGFVVPKGIMLPTPTVEVKDADSGITLNVGTLSTDSGDADGYIAGVSVASATIVKASVANGALTMGALLFVQDSVNAGDEAPEGNVSMLGKAITYTLASGADTASGYIHLPYRLTA